MADSRITLRAETRAHPSDMGNVSRIRKWWDEIRISAGRMANRLGIPGMIKETIIPDEVTGQIIEIKANPLYIIISIDGRDYYFHRFSGRFGGTGSGCG